MLKFNPKKVFAMRGIEKATNFLVRLGFSYPKASSFLESKSRFVQIKDIERLCIKLNCTPNDLFEWKPDANTVLPDSHALNALLNTGENKNLQQLVKDIPAEKLKLIENLLAELKS
ncbi:MAG: helix-turn-helix transcriptional regulator [Pyrinomonadaceae bacterium]|nr:helix-turn-helix transcriptional regulator [Pyrinomonadaceae bacterium]